MSSAAHDCLPALLPVGLVLTASFGCALMVGVAQSGGVQLHPNAAERRSSRIESCSEPVKPLQPAFGDAAREVIIPRGGDGGVGVGCSEDGHAADACDEHDAASRDVLGGIRACGGRGLGHAGMVGARLCHRVEKLERAPEDEQAGDSRGDEGRDGEPRDQGQDPADSACDAQAQGEGGHVAGERRHHESHTLRGRAGVQLRDDAGPIVLAKGRDLFAAEIREEARWAGVPIIENPPLARSLYRMVEPGQSIPFELYSAVAGILAYLYRQKMEERMRRERQAQQEHEVIRQWPRSLPRHARCWRWNVSEEVAGALVAPAKMQTLLLPVTAISMIFVMLIPVPSFVLDLLLAASITASVIVFLTAVQVRRAVDFSVFPTLLLLLTLFRLSLNLASSRRILLHGHEGTAAAGSVIEAFGSSLWAGTMLSASSCSSR